LHGDWSGQRLSLYLDDRLRHAIEPDRAYRTLDAIAMKIAALVGATMTM
jgi:hypothetical protein